MSDAECRKLQLQSLALLFVTYSVLGAVTEHLSYNVLQPVRCKVNGNECRQKLLANPILTGFPIYGIGALLVIGLNRCLQQPLGKMHPVGKLVFDFLFYGTLLTALEYVAGLLVGAGPKARRDNGLIHSWDYSEEPFNYRGIVNLRCSFGFALFAVLVIRISPHLERFFRTGLCGGPCGIECPLISK